MPPTSILKIHAKKATHHREIWQLMVNHPLNVAGIDVDKVDTSCFLADDKEDIDRKINELEEMMLWIESGKEDAPQPESSASYAMSLSEENLGRHDDLHEQADPEAQRDADRKLGHSIPHL